MRWIQHPQSPIWVTEHTYTNWRAIFVIPYLHTWHTYVHMYTGTWLFSSFSAGSHYRFIPPHFTILRIILVSFAFGYLLSMVFVSECTYLRKSFMCYTHIAYISMCIHVWVLLLLQSFASQLSDCATICMIIVCIAYCYSCWFLLLLRRIVYIVELTAMLGTYTVIW